MATMVHPNITELHSNLADAKNQKETARIISKAFEELRDQSVSSIEQKEISMKEYLKRFATKEDLGKLRMEIQLETYKMLSSAKWQVIGVVILAFFGQVVLKHFGFF